MKKLTISEIELQLQNIHSEEDPIFDSFITDERKGVQQLITKWKKQREKEKLIHEKFREMSRYEAKL